jgi:hypothetical protein
VRREGKEDGFGRERKGLGEEKKWRMRKEREVDGWEKNRDVGRE